MNAMRNLTACLPMARVASVRKVLADRAIQDRLAVMGLVPAALREDNARRFLGLAG
ncbi:MAG: hypothetical protein ACREVR_20555 [Burkholderiales bacterium]